MLRILIVLGMLGIAIILTWAVYSPGLVGGFVFDDGPNIVQNTNLQLAPLDAEHIRRAAFSSDSGMLKRPISMLSFAVNYSLTGLNPYYFKITNLAIHGFNGISLYFLSLLLLQALNLRSRHALSPWQSQFVALAAAAAWMVHPFNLTSVLYVVQRMTSLSATFTIWGLIAFTWGRLRLLHGQNGYGWILASLLLLLPLATLSKENGLLLPAYMLAIELTLFQFKATTSGKRFLAALFGISVLLPALAFLTFVALNPSWLPSMFIGRDFTLGERVMTQARVLWFYLHEIVTPNPAEMGLFHDDIVNSHSLFAPISTLYGLAGLLLLLVLSWAARNKAPLISFAILFFFAGHLIESSVWPLEMTHEHRNYLPMFGILLAIFYYLLFPFKYIGTLRMRQLVVVLLLGLFAYGTWSRATHWANGFELARYDVENHPGSARDNNEMANAFATVDTGDAAANQANYLKAMDYYERSVAANPGYTNGLFAMLIINSRGDRQVDPRWIPELMHRLEFFPTDPDAGNKLMRLVQCKVENKCKLENQVLLDLINASLRNPTTVGARRALVLSCMNYYLIDLAADYTRAHDVMRQMVQLDPKEMEYRLNLIQFLIAMQKMDEARQELDAAKRMDHLSAYTARIKQIEQQLGPR